MGGRGGAELESQAAVRTTPPLHTHDMYLALHLFRESLIGVKTVCSMTHIQQQCALLSDARASCWLGGWCHGVLTQRGQGVRLGAGELDNLQTKVPVSEAEGHVVRKWG